jgi:AcrR family transcriptional regulator
MSRTSQRARLTREESRAQTRERLMSAAREVFVRRGYHGASIYEIAEEAGYTIGALYAHFGGKEGLLLELLDRHFAEQLERFTAQLDEAPDAHAPIGLGSDFWTSFLARDPAVVVLFVEFWSIAVRDPELRPRFTESLRKLRGQLAGVIEAQRELAGLRVAASPSEAAIVLDAMIDGFALHKLADPDGVPDELLARALRWLMMGALGEREQAGADRGRDSTPEAR